MINIINKRNNYVLDFPSVMLYIFLLAGMLIGPSIEAHAGEKLATESFRTVESTYDDSTFESMDSDGKATHIDINSDCQ